jgi:hypothetical protein
VVRPGGYDHGFAPIYWRSSPFTEALVRNAEHALTFTGRAAELPPPPLDRDGNGRWLRTVGGQELVDRFQNAQRKELTS